MAIDIATRVKWCSFTKVHSPMTYHMGWSILVAKGQNQLVLGYKVILTLEKKCLTYGVLK
jgi:hypothetical protein